MYDCMNRTTIKIEGRAALIMYMATEIKIQGSSKKVSSQFQLRFKKIEVKGNSRQSPDFYANLRTRFVGRFGGKSRKICTKIHYLRQLLLSFLENYHKLSKTILDNHHRLS